MDYIQALKKIYNVKTIEKVPYNVLVTVEQAAAVCEKLGGELVSRQIIAAIVVTTDSMHSYSKHSPHYVGE